MANLMIALFANYDARGVLTGFYYRISILDSWSVYKIGCRKKVKTCVFVYLKNFKPIQNVQSKHMLWNKIVFVV